MAENTEELINEVFGTAGDAGSGDESDDANPRVKVVGPIIAKDTYKPAKETSGLSAKARLETDLNSLPDAFNPQSMNLDLDSWVSGVMRGQERRDGTFWKEGEPLQAGGMTEAFVPIPRQPGAGLGSAASLPFDKKVSKRSAADPMSASTTYMKVSDKLVKRNTSLEVGCNAKVTKGAHEGMMCKVLAFPDATEYPRKDDPIPVSLLPGGSEAKVLMGHLERATDADVQSYSRAQKRKAEEGRDVETKRRRKAVPLKWVLKTGMLVRVIDRDLAAGEFYNEKLRVCDIPSPCEFALKTPSGGIVEGVREDQVWSKVGLEQGVNNLVHKIQ